jgi:hypothetical protein
LRLQCGMPCSKLEVSTVQHGTLSGTGYLHQSPASDALEIGGCDWPKFLLMQLKLLVGGPLGSMQ